MRATQGAMMGASILRCFEEDKFEREEISLNWGKTGNGAKGFQSNMLKTWKALA